MGSKIFWQTVIQNPDNLSVDLKRPHLHLPLPLVESAFCQSRGPVKKGRETPASQGPVVACCAGHLDVMSWRQREMSLC